MDQIIETSELLMEVDILSKKEKDEIIKNIDNDLFYYYQNFFDLNKFRAGSSGLLTPILIVVSVILITGFVIFISNNTFLEFQNDSLAYKPSNLPETEWGILTLFIEETSSKLEIKEQEIRGYQLEISDYDRRLQQLRELIVAKEEVETRLSIEREILKNNGLSDAAIATRIDRLEDSLISDLSPELVAFYDSSIDELNEKIEQLLKDKSVSEEGLEQSLSEKAILETEYNILQEEEDQNINTDSELLVIIEKMNKFSDMTIKYEKERLFEKEVNNAYIEILENLNENNSLEAKEKLTDLQELILEKSDPDKVQTINILQDYINHNRLSLQVADREVSEYNDLVFELDLMTEKILLEDGKTNFVSDGGNIDSFISDIPAVAEALSIMNRKKSAESPPIDNLTQGAVLVGAISYINFDTVVIKSAPGADIPIGESFSIYRKNDTTRESVLGLGKITNFSDDLIFGKIESIKNLENRLEPGDLIYLNIK